MSHKHDLNNHLFSYLITDNNFKPAPEQQKTLRAAAE